ncbi:MAG TPA: MMPL family transporter [Deltaproteobacteria bacterium]|nr:MMPL family transporter [Deltaproteobacteria bacterium]
MDRFLRAFSDFVIRRRTILLIIILLTTAYFAWQCTRLTVNNDMDTWLPEKDKTAELIRQADRDFSSNDILFTVIEFPEGVFNAGSLDLIARVTRDIEGIKGIFNVTSLTNIIDIRKTDDGIEVGELVPEIPRTPEEIEGLKRYVFSKETYRNTIVSSDSKYTAVLINIESSVDAVRVAEKVFSSVEKLVPGHAHYFGGNPAIIYFMNFYMMDDTRRLVPIILVVVSIVMALGLRSVTGIILPLTMVVFSITITFGLMPLFGLSANILSPPVAVLLIALGSDYAVHYYNHYRSQQDASRSTSEITIPVTMSALTTIAGLLTFSTTKIEVLNNFGVELAWGLGVAWILSLVLMAIIVSFFKVRSAAQEQERARTYLFTRVMERLAAWIYGHAKSVIALIGIVVVFMGWGISRITTEIDFIGQLPVDSPPRVGCNILMDHFSGMYAFNVYVRGDISDPAVMNRMNYLENYFRSEDDLAGFTSINALIAQENWLLNGVYAVPETRQGVSNLWFLLEGQEVLKTFVTPEKDKALVNSLAREAATTRLRSMADRLEAFLQAETSGEILTIDPARLNPEGRQALREVRIREAGRQIAWLSGYYDRRYKPDETTISGRLAQGLAGLEEATDMEPVWQDLQRYLDEETVEVLPPNAIGRILALFRDQWKGRHGSQVQSGMARIAAQSGAMNEEDAALTADGLIRRFDSSLRLQQAAALERSLGDALTSDLGQDRDFRKRLGGVLWELLSENPVFFSKQVASVAGLDDAVTARSAVKVDQAGMPETVRVVHRLLIRSQIQSLALAISIVFLMVSLASRSLRRGLASMLTVLAPLTCILGFMGIMHIPLDMGTVLCGSLVVGLGIDGSIHFIYYYQRMHATGVRKPRALQLTMAHVGRAVVTANGTTLAGFIVLLFSNTTAVKNFAKVNSTAIFLVTLTILTLLPALVSVLHLDGTEDGEAGSGPAA